MLKEIASEIRHGRHIDLYGAILLSLTVAVLAVAGVASNRVSNAAILALIALVASSLYSVKRHIESAASTVEASADQSRMASERAVLAAEVVASAQRGSSIESFTAFPEAFSAWAGTAGAEFETVDIAAYTSNAFATQLRFQDVGAACCRVLLLHDPNHPSWRTNAAGSQQSLETALATLAHLRRVGRIQDLEIRIFPMQATFYFAIADGRSVITGLLWPHELSGLEPGMVFVAEADVAERGPIGSFQSWFSDVFEQADEVSLDA